MALTRTMLKAMDIEKENIEKIIAAHTETVDALKEARDEYKAKVESLQESNNELDKQATRRVHRLQERHKREG